MPSSPPPCADGETVELGGGDEVSLLSIVEDLQGGNPKLDLAIRIMNFLETALKVVEAIAVFADGDVPLENLATAGALLTVEPSAVALSSSCTETVRSTTTNTTPPAEGTSTPTAKPKKATGACPDEPTNPGADPAPGSVEDRAAEASPGGPVLEDELFGGFGCDWVFGKEGDDLVRGGQDDDVVEGGPDGLIGDDVVVGDNATPVITWPSHLEALVAVVALGDTDPPAVAIVLADVLMPNDTVDALDSACASSYLACDDDDVFAGHGDDQVWGGPGHDRLFGGHNRDDLDLIFGGWGQDAMQADVSVNGPDAGDRLIDGNGAYNAFFVCDGGLGDPP